MIAPELSTRTESGHTLPLLVWRLPAPMLVASTASVGGGIGLRRWVLNAHVRKDYVRHDLGVHAAELAASQQLSEGGVTMFTAARVERVAHSHDGANDDPIDGLVTVDATVGLTDPTWAADGPVIPNESRRAKSARTVHSDGITAGTINIVAQLPVRFTEAALLGALCTATEAKTQALLAAGITGTGTPSDAVTLVCSATGPAEIFGGVRSSFGARLATAVYDAVHAGTLAWLAGRAEAESDGTRLDTAARSVSARPGTVQELQKP